MAILGLDRYVLKCVEGLLIASKRVDGDYEQHLEMIESVKEFKERRRNERSNVLKQKKLHGQFFNQIEEVAGEEKWLWLRDGSMKREVELLIMAAQARAIMTNAIKANIDKTQAESVDYVVKVDETVRHKCVNALYWQHKGSIKGGMTGWAERYIGKYVEKLVLM